MGKIVITGTGRCGTSFLMHLFTALGFNTGYSLDECVWHLKRSKCDGGIEHSIGTKLFDKSDIVKNPLWFYKPESLDFDIDYLIVPIRSLMSVAKSRDRNNGYGGFWMGADDITGQIKIDSSALSYFIEHMVLKDLQVIFLDFPRIAKDDEYLYSKLINLLSEESFKMPMFYGIDGYVGHFKKVFNEIADPEKVHV